jgi:hypothetical protein
MSLSAITEGGKHMHGWGKRFRLAAAVVGLATGGVAAAGVAPASAGVGGPAFYVDGQVYRTVGTPTNLSGTGAPAHSWDVIYEFFGAQLNLAEAASGDRGYNGGRWQVHGLAFPAGYAAAATDGDADGDGVFDSAAEVNAALAAGSAVDTGVIKQSSAPRYRCPPTER